MTSPLLTNREDAYFRITGEGDHSVVSKIMGVSPTNEWSEGDINPRLGKPYTFMSWKLESELDDTHSIEEHLEKIFSFVDPLKNNLEKIWQSYELCIQCVGYFPPSGHGIHLNKNTIQRAALLGVSFDMDFYYVSGNGHDLDYH